MKTHLKQDSRDIHVLDHFAAPLIIPDEMEFDRGLTNIIEQPGEVDCTAISAVDVGTDQTGDTYDISDQWINTPHTAQGANPRDSMATMIRRGLKSLTTGLQDTRWKSYMRADGDSGDYAQTTQMSMLATNSSTTVASNYYAEWTMTPEGGVLPPGKTRVSGHDYKISGWHTTPTGLQFHVKFWTGGFKWMPKEVYNAEMAMYGTGAYIPTTTTAQGQVISFIQTIIDWAINQCLAIQRQIIQLKTQPMSDTITPKITTTIPENKPPMIVRWAQTIAKFEGANPALNNPGNFKFSTLMQSWGGEQAGAGSDGGFFCKFTSYEKGFLALVNFLTLGCEDELKAYHNARTIKEFTLVYTNHPAPAFDYSDSLIKELGVTPDTQISSFLS